MYGRLKQNYHRKIGINLKERIDRFNSCHCQIF
jgi:hypothetical protein